jgi:hypothetical protein
MLRLLAKALKINEEELKKIFNSISKDYSDNTVKGKNIYSVIGGGNENLTKDMETLKKDMEVLKLQVELLKKDLLIERNKK